MDIQHILDIAIYHHLAGRLPDAERFYKKVLQANPDQPKALQLLGVIAHQVGKNDVAIDLISKALTINPDYDEAHNNIGNVYLELGRLDEAINSYHRCLRANPRYVKAYNNLGTALQELGKLDYAIDNYHQALSIKPEYGEAQNNLGMALLAKGKYEDAFSSLQKALEIIPENSVVHSSLIFIQDLIPDIDQVEQQTERKRWNDKFIRPLANSIKPHNNNRDPYRRLRIGYVSADFRQHSAYYGFASLILEHDRENFDVFCYDATVLRDQVSGFLNDAATQWRYVKNLSDEALAQTIRDDAIDILFDLSGHTNGNRLVAFGHKPAPIQITGIGHQAAGVSTIDYRLTTALATPPSEESLYPEKPMYLETYFGYTPQQNAPPVGPLPYTSNGYVTFGFLGRFSKISNVVLSVWANILKKVPESRLLLKYRQLEDPAARQQIKDTFAGFGINPDRLILLGRTDQHEHLETHNKVDIVLDTFPHSGGMTTMESLWMGVPVIGMVSQEKMGGRISEIICAPLGLDEWYTRNVDEYPKIAVHWAKRLDDLATIRQGLRQRVSDVYSRFPLNVEKAYRLIWQRWCKGEEPTPLYPAEEPSVVNWE